MPIYLKSSWWVPVGWRIQPCTQRLQTVIFSRLLTQLHKVLYSLRYSLEFLFVVGSISPFHSKTELFQHGSWRTSREYPFANSIFLSSVAYQNDEFFVFGGVTSTSTSSSTIAVFNQQTESWRKAGSLNSVRSSNQKSTIYTFFRNLIIWTLQRSERT